MSLGFIRPVAPQAPKAAPLEIATVSRPTPRRPSYLLLCALSALVVTFASLFGWAYASWRHAAYCDNLVANGVWVSATTCDAATSSHCLGINGIYYTGAAPEHDCHSHWSKIHSTTSGNGRRLQSPSVARKACKRRECREDGLMN